MFEKLYIGVMHSGKSDCITALYKKKKEEGESAFLILPESVYGRTPFIQVFDKCVFKDIALLKDVYEIITSDAQLKDHYLFVDEIQFLSDEEIEVLFTLAECDNVHVYCAGLKEDYLTDDFKQTKKIVKGSNVAPYDISYLCEDCGRNRAVHNLLFIKGKVVSRSLNENNMVLETDEAPLYKSVCVKCKEKYLK